MRTPQSVKIRRSRAGVGEVSDARDGAGREPAARPAGGSRRGWLIGIGFATAAAVTGIGGSAAALPQPTVAQVQARLNALNSKAAHLGQQYDQVLQQLSVADQRLKVLTKETAGYRATFDAMRLQIGRIAAVAYEQGGASSPVALLTSQSPQQVLDQSSILTELSIANSSQISQYRAASRQLLSAQQAAAQGRASILQLKRTLAKRIAVLNKMKKQAENLLASLQPSQRVGIGPGGGGKASYHGPTSTPAQKAVAFAYNAIGCPYVYGATGPCGAGYDCSGLMMAAWASAGISIPRVSWDQMASLQAVSLSNIQPGDILGFAGNSHVGMYVGNGWLIDAPVPGANVEKVQLSGWYQSNLDGAVRP